MGSQAKNVDFTALRSHKLAKASTSRPPRHSAAPMGKRKPIEVKLRLAEVVAVVAGLLSLYPPTTG
ncbi:hypothetical protein Pfo_009132 [Paulownia fortunei]|nr:hypothetical protein Pfo_009132 [Paulownia fortunei]